MKIGILTITPNIGYGGIMQAYALQYILQQQGHEVFLLNRKTKYSLFKKLLIFLKRFIKKYLYGKDIALTLNKEYTFISQNTEPFLQKYIRRTSDIYTTNELSETAQQGFEAFVVGSDQVWRPKYVPDIYNYYLDFLKEDRNIKRIAYAASFGTDKWEYSADEENKCLMLIQQFDAVSVRERSAVGLCEKHFDVSPDLVLDPTLLLPKSIYLNLIKNNNSVAELDMFTYILDMNDDKRKMIKQIQQNLGLELFEFNTNGENREAPLSERIAPSVESWIYGFSSAKYIVTDSFHGCAFSIIFNKPFLVYGNIERGLSRFTSLLGLLNLDDSPIPSTYEITSNRLTAPINWEEVNQIIMRKQEDSLHFLKNSLVN
mgnify:CR=1 FL=1